MLLRRENAIILCFTLQFMDLPTDTNLTVILIATKIKPQMSKFLEIRLKRNCLVLATRNLFVVHLELIIGNIEIEHEQVLVLSVQGFSF